MNIVAKLFGKQFSFYCAKKKKKKIFLSFFLAKFSFKHIPSSFNVIKMQLLERAIKTNHKLIFILQNIECASSPDSFYKKI